MANGDVDNHGFLNMNTIMETVRIKRYKTCITTAISIHLEKEISTVLWKIDWKRERQKNKRQRGTISCWRSCFIYILLFMFSFIDAMRCCFLDFLLLLLFLSSCFNLLDVVQFENKLRSSYRYLYMHCRICSTLFTEPLTLVNIFN